MAVLSPTVKQQFFDLNGDLLIGGLLHTTENLTDTDKATWKDQAELNVNANPIVLDSRGECDLRLTPGEAYRLRLEDSLGNLIWQRDNIIGSGISGIEVDSIETLKGTTPSGLDLMHVLGYYVPGDNGGALWYWEPLSVESENGVTVIEINSSPPTGRWLRTNTDFITFKQAGAKGDGSTDDTSFINAAREWVNANNQTLVGTEGEYLITGALTFGSSTNLKMEKGAFFSAGSTQTVTINGTLERGLGKCFGDNITAIISGGQVEPELWGAINMTIDAAHDNVVPIQAAIDCANASGGGTVFLNNMYAVLALGPEDDLTGGNGNLKNKDNVTIEGQGFSTGITRLAGGPTDRKIFGQANISLVKKKNMHWNNFKMVGPGSGINTDTGHGIDGFHMEDTSITNMFYEDINGDGVYLNSSAGVVVSDIFCQDCSRQGISVVQGKNYTVKHIRGKNTGASSMVHLVDIEPNTNNTIVGLTLDDIELFDANTIGCEIITVGPLTRAVFDLKMSNIGSEIMRVGRIQNGTISNCIVHAPDDSTVVTEFANMDNVAVSGITISTPSGYSSSDGIRVNMSGVTDCSFGNFIMDKPAGGNVAELFAVTNCSFPSWRLNNFTSTGIFIRDSTHLTFDSLMLFGDGATSGVLLSKSSVDSTNIRFDNSIIDDCTNALRTITGDFTDIWFKGDFTGCTNEIVTDSGTLTLFEDTELAVRQEWTPTLYVGSDDDTKFTYNSQTGDYIVIGNLVMFNGEIDLSANTGGAVPVYMKVPTANDTPPRGAKGGTLNSEMAATITIDAQNDFANMFLGINASTLTIMNFFDKTTGTSLDANLITATNVFRFNGWYMLS